MNKTKRKTKLVIVIILLSMMAMYSYMPDARAASITDARDRLTDSDIGVMSGHIISFTTSVPLLVNDRIDVNFPNDGNPFGNLTSAAFTCPSGTASSAPDAFTIRCTVGGGGLTAGAHVITATTTNPSSAAFNPGKTLEILTTNALSSHTMREHVFVMVAILSSVTVTAKVTDTLNFIITGLATSTIVNGVATTGSTSPSAINFGTLVVGASSTLGQQLQVTTNADDGYSVTVEQDHELLSNSGSNINSFNNSQDNTGSTSPTTWVAPFGTLDVYNTYGHMGLTTDDADLSTISGGGFGLGADFTGSKYAGLYGSSTMIIMAHNGPADGNTQNKGMAKIAYSVLITPLQEAGDYTNTLTYICTPQY
jgi:hypothetical protein